MTRLFTLEDKKFSGKTKYFVGKAFEINGSTESTNTDTKCAWSTDESVDSGSLEYLPCTITAFSTNDPAAGSTTTLDVNSGFDSLSFEKPSTTFTKYKHYLITFTNDQEIIDAGSKKIIFAKKEDVATKNVKFTNIYSSSLASGEYLLVLKTKTKQSWT